MRYSYWMSSILWVAALYHLSWGLLIIAFPIQTSRLAGVDPANYPQLWQGFGMVFAVFGVGYAIAARNPIKHWLLVFVGLLGKVLGPTGFLLSALSGELPLANGWTFITDDLIWWIPFSWILYQAYRAGR